MKLFGREAHRPPMAFLLLLISAAFGVQVAVYYFGVFRPQARSVATLHAELQRRERAMALASKLENAHPGVLRRLRAVDSTISSGLGLSASAVDLMTKSARAHGLDLELVEPGSTERAGSQRSTPVTLNLNGQYVDFVSWLQELEASDVLVTVDQMFIEGSPTGRHLFHVVLCTYATSAKG